MAREFSIDEFVKEHKATDAQVKAGKAKRCTAKGCVCGNVPLTLDAFYRDKSQADGHSPWCKAKERTYNAAYYAGLKKVHAPKKSAIEDDKGVKVFERTMKSERVQRTRVAPVVKARNTRKATPKATPKRKVTRTSKRVAVKA